MHISRRTYAYVHKKSLSISYKCWAGKTKESISWICCLAIMLHKLNLVFLYCWGRIGVHGSSNKCPSPLKSEIFFFKGFNAIQVGHSYILISTQSSVKKVLRHGSGMWFFWLDSDWFRTSSFNIATWFVLRIALYVEASFLFWLHMITIIIFKLLIWRWIKRHIALWSNRDWCEVEDTIDQYWKISTVHSDQANWIVSGKIKDH